MNIYQNRKAKGLCGRCGKRPMRDGGTMCDSCAEYMREYQLRRYHNANPGYRPGAHGIPAREHIVTFRGQEIFRGTVVDIAQEFDVCVDAAYKWVRKGSFGRVFKITRADLTKQGTL